MMFLFSSSFAKREGVILNKEQLNDKSSDTIILIYKLI